MNEEQSESVVPNREFPQAFGLMNIIVGFVMLLMGAWDALTHYIQSDLDSKNRMLGHPVTDIWITNYYFAAIYTGLLLNLLMIISGAGLLVLAEWARRLALGVAWLEILYWVAHVVVTMVLVLPILEREQHEGLRVVYIAVAAAVYLSLLVWFLTRPRARAACLKVTPLVEKT
jgi:hypothetical protein